MKWNRVFEDLPVRSLSDCFEDAKKEVFGQVQYLCAPGLSICVSLRRNGHFVQTLVKNMVEPFQS